MKNVNCIRVLSVDDHPLVREGVRVIINSQADMSLAGTASNGKEGIEAFRALRPDVTLMDLRLPDLSGHDVMIAIRSEFPDARIIVLTTFEGDMDVQRALKAGARGYLLKSMLAQQMLEMIRQVHAGQKRVPAEIAAGLAEHLGDEALSQREVEVLQQVAAGQPESGYRREAVHRGGDRQGACQAHHGQAGRQRSDAVGGDRSPPRHHSTVGQASSVAYGTMRKSRITSLAYGTAKNSDWQAKAPAPHACKTFRDNVGRRFRLPIRRSCDFFSDPYARGYTAVAMLSIGRMHGSPARQQGDQSDDFFHSPSGE